MNDYIPSPTDIPELPAKVKRIFDMEIEAEYQDKLSQYAIILANYLSTVGEDYARALSRYYNEVTRQLATYEKVSEAEHQAKAGAAYKQQKVLEYRWLALIELINAIKARVKTLTGERDKTTDQ